MQSILLVEDNPADAHLLKEMLRISDIPDHITHAQDGEIALKRLEDAEKGQLKLPRLVLLDLNLPKVDGFEVLRCIKTSQRWSSVPVVVMSSSKRPSDKSRSLEGGAVCYLEKPGNLEQLVAVGRQIKGLLA